MVCVPGGSKFKEQVPDELQRVRTPRGSEFKHSAPDELVCVPGDSKSKYQVPDERGATRGLDTLQGQISKSTHFRA
jgi:hypothetical protein